MSAIGMHHGISFEDYRAADGVSVSTLKRMQDAPAKARLDRSETRALSFGTLAHCAILEGYWLEARYCPTELERRGTKAWDAEQEEAGTRTLVKLEDWDAARRMRDAVMAHPVAGELLGPGLTIEGSAWWRDEATGLLCKMRPDGYREDMRVLVDVKTTTDASPEEFARSVAKYRYHWQDAMYRDGTAATLWKPEAFVFIPVEKEPPYLPAAYELSPGDTQLGREKVRANLERYAECDRTNVWPGYSDTIQTLTLPAWAA